MTMKNRSINIICISYKSFNEAKSLQNKINEVPEEFGIRKTNCQANRTFVIR